MAAKAHGSTSLKLLPAKHVEGCFPRHQLSKSLKLADCEWLWRQRLRTLAQPLGPKAKQKPAIATWEKPGYGRIVEAIPGAAFLKSRL